MARMHGAICHWSMANCHLSLKKQCVSPYTRHMNMRNEILSAIGHWSILICHCGSQVARQAIAIQPPSKADLLEERLIEFAATIINFSARLPRTSEARPEERKAALTLFISCELWRRSLMRRPCGCGINKKSRSHRSAADGVVAHTQILQNTFRGVTPERHPRPRLFGTGPFFW